MRVGVGGSFSDHHLYTSVAVFPVFQLPARESYIKKTNLDRPYLTIAKDQTLTTVRSWVKD